MDNAPESYELALPDAIPPTSASYWVVPGRLLAGAYPGARDADEHRGKVQALVDVRDLHAPTRTEMTAILDRFVKQCLAR